MDSGFVYQNIVKVFAEERGLLNANCGTLLGCFRTQKRPLFVYGRISLETYVNNGGAFNAKMVNGRICDGIQCFSLKGNHYENVRRLYWRRSGIGISC